MKRIVFKRFMLCLCLMFLLAPTVVVKAAPTEAPAEAAEFKDDTNSSGSEQYIINNGDDAKVAPQNAEQNASNSNADPNSQYVYDGEKGNEPLDFTDSGTTIGEWFVSLLKNNIVNLGLLAICVVGLLLVLRKQNKEDNNVNE